MRREKRCVVGGPSGPNKKASQLKQLYKSQCKSVLPQSSRRKRQEGIWLRSQTCIFQVYFLNISLFLLFFVSAALWVLCGDWLLGFWKGSSRWLKFFAVSFVIPVVFWAGIGLFIVSSGFLLTTCRNDDVYALIKKAVSRN